MNRAEELKKARDAMGLSNMSLLEFSKSGLYQGSGGAGGAAIKLTNERLAQQPQVQPQPVLDKARSLAVSALRSEPVQQPQSQPQPVLDKARSLAVSALRSEPVQQPQFGQNLQRFMDLEPKVPMPTPSQPLVPIGAPSFSQQPNQYSAQMQGGLQIPSVVEPQQQPSIVGVPSPVGASYGQQASVAPASLGGGQIQFDANDLLLMNPLERMQYTAQIEQQQLMQSGEAQLKPYQEQVSVYDAEIKSLQDQIDSLADLTPKQKEQLETLKLDVEEDKKRALERVEKNAQRQKEQVNEVLSSKGFARSTKRADLLDEISDQVALDVADIEKQSQRRITEIETSILATNTALAKELGDALKSTYKERSALQLKVAEKTGDIVKEIFKASPLNPTNILGAIDKMKAWEDKERDFMLKEKQFSFEMMKWNDTEARHLQTQAMNALKFGVDTMGSSFINEMGDQELSMMSALTGVPLNQFKGVFSTMEEQKLGWEQMKFVQGHQNQLELSDLNFRNQVSLKSLDQDFQRDMKLLQTELDWDKFTSEYRFKSESDAMSAAKKLQGLGLISGAYGEKATSSNGGNYFTFDAPVPHPNEKANVFVKAANSVIANFMPNGFNFLSTKVSSSLVGHCAWFAQQIVDLPKVGDSLDQKSKTFQAQKSQGKAFSIGEKPIEVGHTIWTNESKQYGHIAVVNAITTDGKLVLTESNRQGSKTVTHNRIVDPNDPMILGVFATKPKSEFREKAEAAGLTAFSAVGSAATGLGKMLDVVGGGGLYGAMSLLGRAGFSNYVGATGLNVSQEGGQVGLTQNPFLQTPVSYQNPILSSIAMGNLSEDMEKEIFKTLMDAGSSGMLDQYSSAQIVNAFSQGAAARESAKKMNAKLTNEDKKVARVMVASLQEEQILSSFSIQDQIKAQSSFNRYLSSRFGDNANLFDVVMDENFYNGLRTSLPSQDKQIIQSIERLIDKDLRFYSGAAISVGEYINKNRQWFPQSFDDEVSALRKQQSRYAGYYSETQMNPLFTEFLPPATKAFLETQVLPRFNQQGAGSGNNLSYYESLIR